MRRVTGILQHSPGGQGKRSGSMTTLCSFSLRRSLGSHDNFHSSDPMTDVRGRGGAGCGGGEEHIVGEIGQFKKQTGDGFIGLTNLIPEFIGNLCTILFPSENNFSLRRVRWWRGMVSWIRVPWKRRKNHRTHLP
jgi:hypothetical protein